MKKIDFSFLNIRSGQFTYVAGVLKVVIFEINT